MENAESEKKWKLETTHAMLQLQMNATKWGTNKGVESNNRIDFIDWSYNVN